MIKTKEYTKYKRLINKCLHFVYCRVCFIL
nr:MAG TPA: hypothetical protein [Caudoviricetes sp.]